MVVEGIADSVAEFVLLVGLPMLFLLFFLEGMVVGKVLQPPAVFVSVIALTQPGASVLALLCIGCTVTVGAGQWTTFRSFDADAPSLLGIRAASPRLETLQGTILERIGERRFAFIDTAFTKYGGLALFTSTFLPVVRGLLAVPAGMSAYPRWRFMVVTMLANMLYFPLLVAVAFGMLHILGF